MTIAATQYPLIGVQPVGNSTVIGVEVATATSGYVPLIPLGTKITVTDPFFGYQELVRLSVPVSTALYPGTLSKLDVSWGYVAVPNTANTGFSVAASLNNVPSNATFVQYAWFVTGGRFVFNSTASVAVTVAIGVAAAGQAGANAAGKQLLNTNVTLAATGTVVKTSVQTQNGSPFLRLTSNSDGLFVGQALTGTGIPASTSIGSIDATGLIVGMVAVGTTTAQNATATGGVTVTATNNDATRFWNTVAFSNAFVQGAIT